MLPRDAELVGIVERVQLGVGVVRALAAYHIDSGNPKGIGPELSQRKNSRHERERQSETKLKDRIGRS